MQFAVTAQFKITVVHQLHSYSTQQKI